MLCNLYLHFQIDFKINTITIIVSQYSTNEISKVLYNAHNSYKFSMVHVRIFLNSLQICMYLAAILRQEIFYFTYYVIFIQFIFFSSLYLRRDNVIKAYSCSCSTREAVHRAITEFITVNGTQNKQQILQTSNPSSKLLQSGIRQKKLSASHTK